MDLVAAGRQVLSKAALKSVPQYKIVCKGYTDKVFAVKSILVDREAYPDAKPDQMVVFVNSAPEAHAFVADMQDEGFTCVALQDYIGAMSHYQGICDGVSGVLISNDSLDLDLDFSQVTCVVNFDVPTKSGGSEPDLKAYLDRLGVFGCAPEKAAAYTLMMTQQDKQCVEKIACFYGKHITELKFSSQGVNCIFTVVPPPPIRLSQIEIAVIKWNLARRTATPVQ